VAAALGDLEERVSRPVVLIVGMLATKDLRGFLRNFTGLARRLIAVPMASDKSLPPEAIAQASQTIGIPADAATGIIPAFAAIARLDLTPPPRILITGSLYLAGEVLAANGTVPSSGEWRSRKGLSAATPIPQPTPCRRVDDGVRWR